MSVVLRAPEVREELMLVVNTIARRGAMEDLIDVDSTVNLEEPSRPILPTYSDSQGDYREHGGP